MEDHATLRARIAELEAQAEDYRSLLNRWQVRCESLRQQHADLTLRLAASEDQLEAMRSLGLSLLSAVVRGSEAKPRAASKRRARR